MSKYNPSNQYEALTYQLEDDVKVLRGLSRLKKPHLAFKNYWKIVSRRAESVLKKKAEA